MFSHKDDLVVSALLFYPLIVQNTDHKTGSALVSLSIWWEPCVFWTSTSLVSPQSMDFTDSSIKPRDLDNPCKKIAKACHLITQGEGNSQTGKDISIILRGPRVAELSTTPWVSLSGSTHGSRTCPAPHPHTQGATTHWSQDQDAGKAVCVHKENKKRGHFLK